MDKMLRKLGWSAARRRQQGESRGNNTHTVSPRPLTFHLLEEITNGFSENRKLGTGAYGTVYKGEHKDGEKIAVKMLHDILGLDNEQFEKEYFNLADLDHKNIVRLVGYCYETRRECVPYDGRMVFADITKRALCFEYMRNGGLDKCLSDETSGHDWCTRYSIIKGICEGLKYLHEELEYPMYHLDLKPANILLDEKLMPKIADFGLSRFFRGEQSQITKSAIGTHGYVPPEYIDASVLSIKFDIFSLGVVIIKIMTGPMGYFRSAEMSAKQFIELVRTNWRKRLRAASVYPLESYSEQVKRCTEIAVSCVEADRSKRPSIGEIVNKLNETETIIRNEVLEPGAFIGRANIAGLEKAVAVLDTLGSGRASSNHRSGFLYGGKNQGNKVNVLAFEVGNTIAKASSLWRSCSDESIKELKEEILHSDGVQILISSNSSELLHIATIDKREDLAIFLREVIRFGDLCTNPIWHNLGRYFEKSTKDYMPQDHSKEHIGATFQQLISLAQNTSELYHELYALDRLEQEFQRKFHEEESVPAARRESVMILHSELKRQRKLVKTLKKKSLWSKPLEDIVEKLVDIVIFLDKQIRDAFGEAVPVGTGFTEQVQNKKLGPCCLALHYAKIINQIESIVSQPLSPRARENLYHGLPITVKSALRSRLQSVNTEEERTVSQIKAEMQKTLCWILPIAENTTRAHQGFGWVSEWAHSGIHMDEKLGSRHSVTGVQTLYHADKAKTEEHILELVVLLHHLMVQVKSRGYVQNMPTKQDQSPSRKLSSEPQADTKHCMSDTSPTNNCEICPSPVSDSERHMLDPLSLRRCEPQPGRGDKAHRSHGSSPAREFVRSRSSASDRELVKHLDVIDGLAD
ncbi:protein PSK SIMULATOR 2 isoform X2 [Triticum aestivum]|uniref:protein PSK SIMULATOR 2 isoform X2 n=1 Tax=Triticum aestivum TaxID=4565 RepID=UPI001D011C04|nr:protein PSK SIMULATOR 2-like isoform X2 [Triticum aestivum]